MRFAENSLLWARGARANGAYHIETLSGSANIMICGRAKLPANTLATANGASVFSGDADCGDAGEIGTWEAMLGAAWPFQHVPGHGAGGPAPW